MGKVLMEITMSLDGYTTGPKVSAEAPFGHGGERLHQVDVRWEIGGRGRALANRSLQHHRRGDHRPAHGRPRYRHPGAKSQSSTAPGFVVTHRPAETIVKKGGTSYIFVTEGIEAAMAEAKVAAG